MKSNYIASLLIISLSLPFTLKAELVKSTSSPQKTSYEINELQNSKCTVRAVCDMQQNFEGGELHNLSAGPYYIAPAGISCSSLVPANTVINISYSTPGMASSSVNTGDAPMTMLEFCIREAARFHNVGKTSYLLPLLNESILLNLCRENSTCSE